MLRCPAVYVDSANSVCHTLSFMAVWISLMSTDSNVVKAGSIGIKCGNK